MPIDKNLSLSNNKPNVLDFPQSTIDTFAVSDEDRQLFISTIKLYLPRMKNHFTYDYAKFHVDTNFKYIDLIYMKQYPLPAVFNKKTKHCIINISALQKRSISNIDMKDLYTILIYAHVCLVMSFNNKLNVKYADPVCKYMGFVFLKLFAKKYGITGSYVDKIPQFRFIVYSYVYRVFFDMDSKAAFKAGSILARYDYSKMNIDPLTYDISDFKVFLQLLSESDVTPGINEYRFLSQVIRSFGTMNLVFFQDIMRFSCILIGSTVGGNSYFTPLYQMFSAGYHAKLIEIIEASVNKVM